ncbi:hypothetical protein [Wenxinia saemankumensis]|uniref:hypothetical protein n=1 Tax=Wenxinia saemankumensis TaxID=1447782 RepID=UPI0011151D53|nr:hypothetical protein [Wenxinia saemankumensis]
MTKFHWRKDPLGLGGKFSNAVRREAMRLHETASENALSAAEIDAYSQALWEIGWAIRNAQPWPAGHEWSPSREAVEMLQAAADLMAAERREAHPAGDYLHSIKGSADVVPLPKGGAR